LGIEAYSGGSQAVTVGNSGKSLYELSTAVGDHSNAADNITALGFWAIASGKSSVAVG
jgi:hypothetical protein